MMRYCWQLLWIVAIALGGCTSPPVAEPLSAVMSQPGQRWRTAAVVVQTATQTLLTPHVIITPENAPQLADIRVPVVLTHSQRAQIPWRDDHGMQYAPVIITGTFGEMPVRMESVDDINTTLSEASVATMPPNQIVRIIGLLNSHPDSVFIHDRTNPRVSRAFRPAWVPGAVPLRIAEGAPVMIEGVRINEELIALVIAPVITR